MEITSKSMRSNKTRHYAVPLDSREPYGQWCVTWLANTTVTRDQALTAMVLAEMVSQSQLTGADVSPRIDSWLRELGLANSDAAKLVSRPPSKEWWL